MRGTKNCKDSIINQPIKVESSVDVWMILDDLGVSRCKLFFWIKDDVNFI